MFLVSSRPRNWILDGVARLGQFDVNRHDTGWSVSYSRLNVPHRIPGGECCHRLSDFGTHRTVLSAVTIVTAVIAALASITVISASTVRIGGAGYRCRVGLAASGAQAIVGLTACP